MSAAEIFAMAAEVRNDAIEDDTSETSELMNDIVNVLRSHGAVNVMKALAEIAADAHEHSQDREAGDEDVDDDVTTALADVAHHLERAAKVIG